MSGNASSSSKLCVSKAVLFALGIAFSCFFFTHLTMHNDHVQMLLKAFRVIDDGQWSHRITSPKHHCEKTYLVTLADPVEAFYAQQLAEGILLRGEKEPCLPAKMEILDDYNVNLTISEGRYHQVKRMFAALGNKVEALHRWRIGDIVLDESLEEGEYRALSDKEIGSF